MLTLPISIAACTLHLMYKTMIIHHAFSQARALFEGLCTCQLVSYLAAVQVPNISIRQVELEVEAALVASFEYSPVLGWQLPERLSFEVGGSVGSSSGTYMACVTSMSAIVGLVAVFCVLACAGWQLP